MYYTDALPLHVIMRHDGQLWLVPVIDGGWVQRTVYKGYQQSLIPFGVGESLMRVHLGIPSDAIATVIM